MGKIDDFSKPEPLVIGHATPIQGTVSYGINMPAGGAGDQWTQRGPECAAFEAWWELNRSKPFKYRESAEELWQAATLAERARCAKIAEDMDDGYETNQAGKIAAAIRKSDAA